jgi:hypothetical protein
LAFSGKFEEATPIDTATARLICGLNKYAKWNVHRNLDVIVRCNYVSIKVRGEFDHGRLRSDFDID